MSTKLELLPSSCGRRNSPKSVPECSDFTLKSLRFFSIKPSEWTFFVVVVVVCF